MSSSFLSRRIKRTSELLKVGASDQVSEYEGRFRSLRGLYDRLLSDFLLLSLAIEKPMKQTPLIINLLRAHLRHKR